MQVILDQALFPPQSPQEAGELLRLFTSALGDVMPTVVLTDPTYVLGANNQKIDAWLAQRSAEEAASLRSVLEYSNLRASSTRGTADMDGATPRSWRLAGAFDVRVERRATSNWETLQLTLADAIDLVLEPVHLVLENQFNDLAFLFHLAGPTLGPSLRKLHDAPGRLQVHGGGTGEVKKWLEGLLTPPLTADKRRRALRAWVFFDQDSGDRDARDPSETAIELMTLCERVHQQCSAGLSWSCLRRREIESYVPDDGLEAESLRGDKAMIQKIIQWRQDPMCAPLAWAFDLKQGLRGDLRSDLSPDTRAALKKNLSLAASMLKAPFDSLAPTDVTMLRSGLGPKRLNEALSAEPPREWASSIPAEYDRGPRTQAPRLALIQSLFDRI